MKFSNLAKYLEKLENVSSRLKITEILSDLYKEINKKEADKMTYLILGRLAPSFESRVFNVAEQMVIQSMAKAYGKSAEQITGLYKEMGDLGNVSESLAKVHKENKKLNIDQVFNALAEIADEEGEGSVERKVNGLADLLGSVDPLSSRYITRIPIGKLRLGFSEKTILDALSWMKNGDKSIKKDLEQAYFVVPDAGRIARKFITEGLKSLKNPKPEVGVPVLPVLTQRIKSPTEMIKKMGEVAVEPKLDGLRIQIHIKKGPKGFIKSFTRNLNETSWMFPELEKVGELIKANEIILDAEAVGVDEKTKKMANFQTTMTRRTKHDISETATSVPISFYIFDILLVDSTNTMQEPYVKRRQILEKITKESKMLRLVKMEITNEPLIITKLHKAYLEEGLEGVIVKKLESKYVPGRTGWRWVKMKEVEEAVGKLSDTVDCVVMGYTRGKGKRAQFGIGQMLVGVRKGDKYLTITKVGSGITENQLVELKKRLTKLEAVKKPKEYMVHKDYIPDFWVEPSLVIEIAADEVSVSPRHSSGYALRFPRMIKFRDDKSPNQATSITEIKELI